MLFFSSNFVKSICIISTSRSGSVEIFDQDQLTEKIMITNLSYLTVKNGRLYNKKLHKDRVIYFFKTGANKLLDFLLPLVLRFTSCDT